MTKITDQQFESILLRLESGESLPSVQTDFPALEEDIAALQDLQDFFAAQRLQQNPNPAGLQGVLSQLKAQSEVPGDDELGWGSFFTSLFRPMAVAMPAVLILGVSGYVWQTQIPASNNADIVSSVALEEPLRSKTMDMAALAESLSAEFALDMEEFESTRNELEPFYEEQLFSYNSIL